MISAYYFQKIILLSRSSEDIRSLVVRLTSYISFSLFSLRLTSWLCKSYTPTASLRLALQQKYASLADGFPPPRPNSLILLQGMMTTRRFSAAARLVRLIKISPRRNDEDESAITSLMLSEHALFAVIFRFSRSAASIRYTAIRRAIPRHRQGTLLLLPMMPH